MNHAFIHTCTVQTRAKKQQLYFDNGTAAFSAAETVTGTGSHATGVVDRFVVETGAWGGGDSAGYLILINVTGTFEDNDVLTSTGGAAIATGANADYKNQHEEFEYYWVNSITSVPCRFFWITRRQRVLEIGESPIKILMCWLPPVAAIVEDEYRIYSTQLGFVGTFDIVSPKPITTQFATPHHYECELTKVPG